MAEFKGGYLYVRSDDNSYKKVCHVTDVYTDTETLAKAKKVIKQYISFAMCGIFDTRNCAGDYMETICDEGNLTIDICYEYEYFEVFGLSMSEFQLLEDFYETLRKEVRAKEKETTEMEDYIVMAEHGVSCIIAHQKQEETEICVKIIKHAVRYEVIYRNWGYEPWHSYTKFYVGIPCLGEIRDDIQHFYGAGCINVNDIKVLLDEALGIARRVNMAKYDYDILKRQLIQRNILGMPSFTLTAPVPTAREEYRARTRLPEIKKVIFHRPATIVEWDDGTKTVVKVQGREKYDKEKGLAMAIAKKAMGNSSYYGTIMNRYLEDEK